MTAYGAYGKSTDPEWRSTVVPLLDRGVVYAVAHVRGGGEVSGVAHHLEYSVYFGARYSYH